MIPTPRVNPDFDGHLEHPIDGPLTNDNIVERLNRAWEVALFLRWVQTLKKTSPEAQSPGDDRSSENQSSE